jgi:cytochrome P450
MLTRRFTTVIGQAGFGSEFNSLSNPHIPLNTYYRNSFVPDGQSSMIFFLSILTYPPLVRMLPLAKNRQVREGVAAINSYIGELINQRNRDISLTVDNPDYFEKTGQKDIITSAMKNGAFSNENLVAQSKTLLGAGHET